MINSKMMPKEQTLQIVHEIANDMPIELQTPLPQSPAAEPVAAMVEPDELKLGQEEIHMDQNRHGDEEIIARPLSAFTARPQLRWKQSTGSESTSPPSPTQGSSPTHSTDSLPISTSPTPRVVPTLSRPRSLQTLIPRARRSSLASIATPEARLSYRGVDLVAPPPHQSKPRPSFIDLLSTQGSSAPVSLGLFSTSPQKEDPPAMPARAPRRVSPTSQEPPAVPPKVYREIPSLPAKSPRRVSPPTMVPVAQPTAPRVTRPAAQPAAQAAEPPSRNPRRTSTLQVAANFLGLGGKPRQPTIIEETDDPILDLDVDAALLPTSSIDRNGREAYDDLWARAEQTILRMQIAYRLKCDELKQVRAEKEKHRDELEEARTRASHLRSQLDGMSAKAVDQHEVMQDLVHELVMVRERVQEDMRKGSIRIVNRRNRNSNSSTTSDSSVESDTSVSPPSSPGEPEHGLFRGQSRSALFRLESCASDSGDESTADSIFSARHRASSPSNESDSSNSTAIDRNNFSIAGANGGLRPFNNLNQENAALKERVAELEDTIEGCLGVFNGTET